MKTAVLLALLRTVALLLSLSLVVAPLAQTNVLVNWAEECGGKPPPVLEEESHKHPAPAGRNAIERGPARSEVFGHGGHFHFPAPVREVLAPPPDRC